MVRDVLLSLATEATRQGRRRISYHDLGVEQLGSVYERVLEYEPGAGGDTLTLSRTSTRRKATGSFYTPRALTEFLVRRTLTPLVEGISADQILQLRIVDPAMGSGAFLVAACRFLAECCEQAMIRDGQWLDGDATAGDARDPAAQRRRAVPVWRRSQRHRGAAGAVVVVVDDARGGSSADLSRSPPRIRQQLDRREARGPGAADAAGADRARRLLPLPLFDDQLAGEVAGHVLPARLRLAMQPSDSLDAVKNKERTLAAARGARRCDREMDRGRGCLVRRGALERRPGAIARHRQRMDRGRDRIEDDAAGWAAPRVARARASGRCPPRRVSLGAGVSRSLLRCRGASERRRRLRCGAWQPALGHVARRYRSSSQRSDTRAMTRGAVAILPLVAVVSASGQRTSQQLPIVRGARAASRQARRARRPDPAVGHRDRSRQCVAAPASVRSDVDRHLARIRQPRADLPDSSQHAVRGAGDDQRRLAPRRCGSAAALPIRKRSIARIATPRRCRSSRSRLEAWSPEHLTIPEIANAASLGIMSAIAERVPALSDPARLAGAIWPRAERHRRSPALRPSDRRAEGDPAGRRRQTAHAVPGRPGALRSGIPIGTAARLLDRAATFERNRIAYRDVASATNKLTLIAAMLPRGTVSTHTVFCLKTALDERSQWCLLGLLNSFVANYLVRLQVTTHVTTALLARLPVPRPREDTAQFDRLVDACEAHLQTRLARCRAPSTRSSTRSPPASTRSPPTSTRTSSRRFH